MRFKVKKQERNKEGKDYPRVEKRNTGGKIIPDDNSCNKSKNNLD